MRNWAGNYRFSAPRHVEAESVEAVQELVARSRRVRALGTRHSFNGLADTDGTLVDVLRLDPAFELDEAARTVTVSAGTGYGEIARFLDRRGWALPNMGSLPHISVGGAISTGTHGSGSANRNLSAAVRGLRFVGTGGRLRDLTPADPDFPGSVVALGALGILVRVTLEVVPAYRIRQDVYDGLKWDVLLGDPAALMGSAFSVSVFTRWSGDTIRQVWLKRRMEHDDDVPDELHGAVRDERPTASIISERDNTTPLGVTRPWLETLPHFRVDSPPSSGNEIQTEYFVPLDRAAEALAAVRPFAPAMDPLLIMSELRSVAADDLWLSPAHHRDSLAIHFTWRNRTAEVLGLVADIERALAPTEPRPHWGKVHTMPSEVVTATYPRIDDFRRLVTRVDPDGVFGGPHLDRAIGTRG